MIPRHRAHPDRMPGTAAFAATALVVALLVPAAAGAARVSHVSPAGTGSACSETAPCSLPTALAASEGGDAIRLAGDTGSYGSPAAPLTATVTIPSEVLVTGESGQSPPVIYTSAQVGVYLGPLAGLADVQIHEDSTEADPDALRNAGENRIERVLAESAGPNSLGCRPSFATVIVDSACLGEAGLWQAVGGTSDWRIRLVNDTIWGTGELGAYFQTPSDNMNIEAVNTIFHGGTTDFEAMGSETGSVHVSLEGSDFANVIDVGNAHTTAPGTAGNVSAPPQLVDPAAGDLRELPGSPTVDAGLSIAESGASDLGGGPRSLSAASSCAGPLPGPTDIGAYELGTQAPPAGCAVVPPSAAQPVPSPPPPPNGGEAHDAVLRIVEIRRHPKTGTATLVVFASSSGRVSVSGKGLVGGSKATAGPGDVALALKARGRAATKLGETGKVTIAASIRFEPAGAAPVSTTGTVHLFAAG